MIAVRETSPGAFAAVTGNEALTSIDGKTRAPLAVVLADSWTAEERAAFGVFLAEPAPIPAGKEAVGPPRYERQGGVVVQVQDVADIDLGVLKAARIEGAWRECARRVEDGAVTVAVSAGAHQFGTDAETRENVLGINAAISRGLPVPDPRNWHPKGATSPISVTHADFALIATALMVAKDNHVTAYLAHKAAISVLADAAAVLAYDVTTGWPSA